LKSTFVELFTWYTLDKEITGGEVKVLVKYNFVILLDETYGTCEVLEKFGEHCPIPPGTVYIRRIFSNMFFFHHKGRTNISFTVEVPSDLPGVRKLIKHIFTYFILFLHRENIMVQWMALTRMVTL